MISEKHLVAVVGAGNWGKNHVRVFRELGVLRSVVELSPALRDKISNEYPDVTVWDNLDAVLGDPSVKGVVIATPAPTHCQLAKAALLAGKDVLIEKPMTLSTKEAEELTALAEKEQRVLMVGHLLLYKAQVAKMVETVKQGTIGTVKFVELRRTKLGKVRSQENVMWSFSPHDVAVLLALVDSSVQKVSAVGLNMIQQNVADDVRLTVEFASGAQALVHASWIWPEDERKTVVIGTEGMLVYDEHENKVWLHRKQVQPDLSITDKGREELSVDNRDALMSEAAHFLECIQTRQTPLTDGRQGIEVTKVLVEGDKAVEKPAAKDYFVHESAYVDEPCKIGKGTQIWHFSHVMKNTEIGENCRIGQNVLVANGVKIGNGVKIQNNVSVYEGVVLEDYVFCGPSMVFTNVRTPRSEFPRNTTNDYIETRIKRGASIGANATIVCGTTLGKCAFVGAGSVVTKDVPDYAVVYGNPATIKGWACACGDVMAGPDAKELKCDRCKTEWTR